MTLKALFLAAVLAIGSPLASADDLPENTGFSTVAKFDLVVEGLTGDNSGNLYTTERSPGAGVACPVWKISIANGTKAAVGNIPAPSPTTQCSPSGIAFDRARDLFVADGDRILTFTPNEATPPTADVYATGVPGTNGIAFDRRGNLWTGDGTTGDGRVWRIKPCDTFPTTPCAPEEMFRVQPMANVLDPTVSSGVSNVGRDARTLPPGTITQSGTATPRLATNTLGSQPLVVNGLAFNSVGDLFIADTARGAIWRVRFNSNGSIRSETGCDTTFTPNTLCLSNIFAVHPLLEGTDGIALDRDGNIWNSVNERNAIVVVTSDRKVVEIFRNEPSMTTRLRNGGPLEFPASPFISGRTLCTSNSDNNRRDNSPNTAGEIAPAGPARGKISCMRPQIEERGLSLPVE